MPSAPSPTDPPELARALARTYNHPSYEDPWGIVEDYKRVQQYHAEHPGDGSHVVAQALELPRSRIRPWLDDDAMPDPMRAIVTCHTRRWFPDTWNSRAVALAVLATAIYAGGSISNEFYRPRWVVDNDREQAIVNRAGGVLGIRFEIKTDTPYELEPQDKASVFGRLLAALGCPQGDKSSNAVTGLPDWIFAAPTRVQRQCARTYVTFRDTDTTDYVQVAEIRGAAYRRQLADLFERVVDDPADVRAVHWPIHVYGDGAETLSQPPVFDGDN
jgi:hypothetical protein